MLAIKIRIKSLMRFGELLYSTYFSSHRMYIANLKHYNIICQLIQVGKNVDCIISKNNAKFPAKYFMSVFQFPFLSIRILSNTKTTIVSYIVYIDMRNINCLHACLHAFLL